jgi:hypothetical protein
LDRRTGKKIRDLRALQNTGLLTVRKPTRMVVGGRRSGSVSVAAVFHGRKRDGQLLLGVRGESPLSHFILHPIRLGEKENPKAPMSGALQNSRGQRADSQLRPLVSPFHSTWAPPVLPARLSAKFRRRSRAALDS